MGGDGCCPWGGGITGLGLETDRGAPGNFPPGAPRKTERAINAFGSSGLSIRYAGGTPSG